MQSIFEKNKRFRRGRLSGERWHPSAIFLKFNNYGIRLLEPSYLTSRTLQSFILPQRKLLYEISPYAMLKGQTIRGRELLHSHLRTVAQLGKSKKKKNQPMGGSKGKWFINVYRGRSGQLVYEFRNVMSHALYINGKRLCCKLPGKAGLVLRTGI